MLTHKIEIKHQISILWGGRLIMKSQLKLAAALFAAYASCSTAFAATCSTSDVTFRYPGAPALTSDYDADQCAGAFTTTFNNLTLGNSNPGNHNVNESFTATNISGTYDLLFGGAQWAAGVKDDPAAGATSTNYLGINWALSITAGQTGSWTLSITDPAPANLPVTLDLLVVLKAGSAEWTAYLFSGEKFTVAGDNPGTFNISFVNGGGQLPNISHMDLFFRPGGGNTQGCFPGSTDPSCPVPEPNNIALLGIGLLGMGAARKFKERKKA